MLPDGKLVYSASDEYGTILVVDYPRYRTLSFDSIYEQSSMYLERPYALVHEYARIMMLVLAFSNARHITLLGLGGGSLLRSLHHYLSHCDFLVVELRSRVYEIAKKYFDIPLDKRVRVSINDAYAQLTQSADGSTDIIFADVYDAYHMSPMQAQREFLSECSRVLSKNGWLVINYHRLPDANTPFFSSLADAYSSVFMCSSAYGNHVLFACKSSLVQLDGAEERISRMETVLNESFIPLFRRLMHITAYPQVSPENRTHESYLAERVYEEELTL